MYIVANAVLNGSAPLVTVHAQGWDAFTQFAHCVWNGIAVRVKHATGTIVFAPQEHHWKTGAPSARAGLIVRYGKRCASRGVILARAVQIADRMPFYPAWVLVAASGQLPHGE